VKQRGYHALESRDVGVRDDTASAEQLTALHAIEQRLGEIVQLLKERS
jgi:hypothetical protein